MQHENMGLSPRIQHSPVEATRAHVNTTRSLKARRRTHSPMEYKTTQQLLRHSSTNMTSAAEHNAEFYNAAPKTLTSHKSTQDWSKTQHGGQNAVRAKLK